MKIRCFRAQDSEGLVSLIAQFRVELAVLRGKRAQSDREAAGKELADYQRKCFPIFVAEEDSKLVGYLVSRVDDNTVWAESLFVLPEFRRKGIASALYGEAERLAAELGSDTVYNWIHPNNDTIVSFLKNRGYDVLNLVELRRPRPNEKPSGTIQVGSHEFKY